MGAAVDDVHHRHRQHVGEGAADITVERQVRFLRRRLGDRQADAQDGVGAKAGLVRRAVEIDQQRVDPFLLGGFVAGQRIEDLAVDGIDGLQHALAAVAALIAVAKLDCLVGAGGGARRNGGAAEGAGLPG